MSKEKDLTRSPLSKGNIYLTDHYYSGGDKILGKLQIFDLVEVPYSGQVVFLIKGAYFQNGYPGGSPVEISINKSSKRVYLSRRLIEASIGASINQYWIGKVSTTSIIGSVFDPFNGEGIFTESQGEGSFEIKLI